MKVYVPAWENETCVLEEFGLVYVTPVPLTTVQLYVSVPFGKPSSVAVAVSVALAALSASRRIVRPVGDASAVLLQGLAT